MKFALRMGRSLLMRHMVEPFVSIERGDERKKRKKMIDKKKKYKVSERRKDEKREEEIMRWRGRGIKALYRRLRVREFPAELEPKAKAEGTDERGGRVKG